jgi:hypothetical protein
LRQRGQVSGLQLTAPVAVDQQAAGDGGQIAAVPAAWFQVGLAQQAFEGVLHQIPGVGRVSARLAPHEGEQPSVVLAVHRRDHVAVDRLGS